MVIHYMKNKENADKLLAEVKAMGRKAISVQADITELDSVMRMKELVVNNLGAPDIVVDNAVIQYEWKSICALETKRNKSGNCQCSGLSDIGFGKLYYGGLHSRMWWQRNALYIIFCRIYS
jgi:NAD(P)-dependent dehydrogenase (short-subunit alcohol dehydrogenase family)